jgi:hypothetical protein
VASVVSGDSSTRGAAKRFGIGIISTAVHWAQRLRGHGEAVLTRITHTLNLTLEEIRSVLIKRHGHHRWLGLLHALLSTKTTCWDKITGE